MARLSHSSTVVLPTAQPGLKMSSKVDETKIIVIDTPNMLSQALRLSAVVVHDCKPEAQSRRARDLSALMNDKEVFTR